MAPSNPALELVDQMMILASSLKEEDLEDPSTFQLLSQLVTLLDSPTETLPEQVVAELSQIQSKVDRFKAAVQMYGLSDIESITKLADSLKASGLLKAETYERLIKSPMVQADRHFKHHQVELKHISKDIRHVGSEKFGKHTVHHYHDKGSGEHIYSINEGDSPTGAHKSAVKVEERSQTFSGARHEITFAATSPSHERRGLSTALHAYAASAHRKVVSPDVVSAAGNRVYDRLHKVPGIRVSRHVHPGEKSLPLTPSLKGSRHVVISGRSPKNAKGKNLKEKIGTFFTKSEEPSLSLEKSWSKKLADEHETKRQAAAYAKMTPEEQKAHRSAERAKRKTMMDHVAVAMEPKKPGPPQTIAPPKPLKPEGEGDKS